MKIQSLILSAFLACGGQITHADSLSSTPEDSAKVTSDVRGFLKKITPEFLYGYTDFNFNSNSADGNFNHYNGHSNLYSVGADHISLSPSMMGGLYYFRINTDINSKFFIAPNPLMRSEQSIKNNTIFGHVLKIITSQIYADLAGGYGHNQFRTFAQIAPGTEQENFASARNNSNNWFVSLNGIYRKSWEKFVMRANLGLLYSRIDAGKYNYNVPAADAIIGIRSLTNKATLVQENVEVGYMINPKLVPFINGGLIQVAHFSNSRDLLDPASVVNGSLPQLNMNKSGFRLGGGFAYTYKNLSMRIEEKYYNAGRTFHSYQTLAAFEYQFT